MHQVEGRLAAVFLLILCCSHRTVMLYCSHSAVLMMIDQVSGKGCILTPDGNPELSRYASVFSWTHVVVSDCEKFITVYYVCGLTPYTRSGGNVSPGVSGHVCDT